MSQTIQTHDLQAEVWAKFPGATAIKADFGQGRQWIGNIAAGFPLFHGVSEAEVWGKMAAEIRINTHRTKCSGLQWGADPVKRPDGLWWALIAPLNLGSTFQTEEEAWAWLASLAKKGSRWFAKAAVANLLAVHHRSLPTSEQAEILAELAEEAKASMGYARKILSEVMPKNGFPDPF